MTNTANFGPGADGFSQHKFGSNEFPFAKIIH